MSLLKFEHVTKEIDGITCRIIESGVSQERIGFLQKLLAHNHVETKTEQLPPKAEGDPITFAIGTPDVTFNPIVKVYNRELRTPEGHHVTPDYWNQKTTKTEPNYWDRSKKDFKI